MDTADQQPPPYSPSATIELDPVAQAATLLPRAVPARSEAEAIQAFQCALQQCFSQPVSDEEFWTRIAEEVRQEERDLDAEQARRFELAVDYILSMHGLSAWTVVRQQREQAAG